MDSNQSEQQFYLSNLTSNIISPAQYPCTVIGSNKNNIHTIVPNANNNNSLNINVKYQNSNESKLAQSISYNHFSNIANSPFNENDDLKFLFNGATKPKKVPHTKRVKGPSIGHCIDNSNDITAAPNQLTILVQKVLPAQVPDHNPPLSAAAHISAAQTIPSVISPQVELVVPSSVNMPTAAMDSIVSVINDVITKATSSDPHDDVFLSVLKSRCDTSSPDIHQMTFIPPHSTTPQFIDVNIENNHKRPSNTSLESTMNSKRSPIKRPRLTEPMYNETKPYQRCQLSAPNSKKLVQEPRISEKSPMLPPLGMTIRRRPCVSIDQLMHNCVKYKRVPFLLSQPHPRTILQDRFIVQNLNTNLPSSRLLSPHDTMDDIDCLVASSPNTSDLDYLSVFTSEQTSTPSINLPGPNLEMLHQPQRTQSPSLSLFHCPNKDYFRLNHPPPSQYSNLSHKNSSTPKSDPLSDTSIVDSETGEMVTSMMKSHQKPHLILNFTSVNYQHNDDFTVIDEDALPTKSSDYFEMPLYSEKVYKSTSLQWKRKLRENNISEDCSSIIAEEDGASHFRDQHPDSLFVGEEPSSIVQVQDSISSKLRDQHIFIGEDSPDSSGVVVQVQGSISSKSKQTFKKLNIIINDKLCKKKPVSLKPGPPKLYLNVKYLRYHVTQTAVLDTHSVISESQFMHLSRESGAILSLPVPGPSDSRQCSFCLQRGDLPESDAGRLLNLDLDRWLHVNCALWCNDVYETQSGALCQVPEGTISAICSLCGQPGAGIRCFYPRCTAKYHVPCARDLHCHFQNDRAMFCVQHQHQATDTALRSLSVPRRVYISRDECSQMVAALNCDRRRLWLRIGSLTVLSLGQLLPNQIHSGNFHTLNYVYPVGFRSRRIMWSSRVLGARSTYMCEIVLEQDRPLFKVMALDDGLEDVTYTSRDCSGSWREILDKIVSQRSRGGLVKFFPEHRVSGEFLFGLTEPLLVRMIESLPGLDGVQDYTFRYDRMQLMGDMPLPITASGSIRCEPYHRVTKQDRKLSVPHQSLSSSQTSVSKYNLAWSQKQERAAVTTTMTMMMMTTSARWQQYRRLRQDWKANVTLRRSGIQGLGLYAARDLDKGTMVIEYVGELIRNEVANKREKEYEARKQGVYMFRLDEDTVIDATRSGDLARYINHCCEPNCVTEVVECERRESHIVIISKRRIDKDEELSYDYKFDFDETGAEDRLPCLCGARTCRRWMN